MVLLCPTENGSGLSTNIAVNIYGRTAAIYKIVNCPLLNIVTILLSYLLRDY